MRKTCCLFIVLAVALATAFAEDTHNSVRYAIRGLVLDENEEPMPGASIVIAGTTLGVGTNSEGHFILRVNENKAYKLTVSFTGYLPKEINIPSVDKERITVRLSPAENQLNEVVVTGTRVEKPLKDVPVLTRVITQQDIQRLNPMNIETLLQYELPGLQIGYNSMSQFPTITYQGVEGEYLLFLVDGERVSGEGADHNVDFTRFNVDNIERIEIIKGSQSTMYGSNALGGVINIITKNANKPFTGNLSARYAGSNGQKYSVSAGTKQNRFSSLSGLTYRTKDSYTIGDTEGKTITTLLPDGSTSQTVNDPTATTIYGYSIWDALQKFGYTFTDKLSAEVKGSLYYNERDTRVGKKYQDFFFDYTLNGKIKYIISDEQQLNVSYIYGNYKKDKKYFEAGFTRTDYRNRTQTIRADYVDTFGDHTLSVGLEANLEYLKHYMMKDSADASNETYAFYVQEDWKVSEAFNVIVGVRGDYHRKYHLHVTPKISVMYRPSDWLTLRTGYSQGFRSPSLKELYQEYDMGGLGWMMLYGNPNLKPETSNQYSLSAEVTKGGFNFSASAYHNRFKGKIAYSALDDGTSDRMYVNAENAKTTGVETIVQWRMNQGLMVSGSYAFIDDYQKINGKNISSVRPHSITFHILYTRKFGKIATNLSLNGQWASQLDTYSYSSKSQEYELITYDTRFLCSLNAGIQFPKGISLNLGIDNLFNYKDKAADSSLQLPQKGLTWVSAVTIDIANLFGL